MVQVPLQPRRDDSWRIVAQLPKYPQRDGIPAPDARPAPGRQAYLHPARSDRADNLHYLHEYLRGRERRPVAEALRCLMTIHTSVPVSIYMQLERYLQYYPSSQILILTAEDLRENPDVTLGRVVEYLGVAPFQFEMLSDANVAERRGRSNRLGQMLESRQGKPAWTAPSAPRPSSSPSSSTPVCRRGSRGRPLTTRPNRPWPSS